jgi:hypothetical protein
VRELVALQPELRRARKGVDYEALRDLLRDRLVEISYSHAGIPGEQDLNKAPE